MERITGSLRVTTPSDREIQMTRRFDAPRKLVFDALTKPELLKRWFHGPEGWALIHCEIDLRVGGGYRYIWHRASDGIDMGLGGFYQEIVAPEKIVATERFDESWYPGEALDTTVLVEQGDQTTLIMTVRYESKEARDGVLASPMDQGAAEGYDLLAEFLRETVEA